MHIWVKDNKNMPDFLQITGGASVKHAVSDTFIIIISERAPLEMIYISLEMTYISMSQEVICKGAKRPRGGGGGLKRGVPPPTAEHIFDRSQKSCGED